MKDFLHLFEEPWLERMVRGRHKYDLAALAEQDTNHSSAAGYQSRGLPLNELLIRLLPGAGRWLHHPQHFLRYSGLLGPAHRHLEGLRSILADYFGYRVVVRGAPVKRHLIDDDARTRLGKQSRQEGGSSLGGGLPLGGSGYLDSWRLDVLLIPGDRRQLQLSLGNNELATLVSQLSHLYLGDRTPVAVFVMARRRFLKAPVLSSRNALSRLGQSVCLAPERYKEGVVRIRLGA